MFAAAYLQRGRGAGELGDVSAHHAGLAAAGTRPRAGLAAFIISHITHRCVTRGILGLSKTEMDAAMLC